jgi:hypothetical protein
LIWTLLGTPLQEGTYLPIKIGLCFFLYNY